MPELIITVGNIGSGKSTIARQYVKDGYVAIARDYLRYAIGEGHYIFNADYEPIIWKVETYMYRKFVDLGVNIIVDEVGMNKNLRKKYINYAKKRGYQIIAMVMKKLPIKEAVNRRMKDPHGQFDRGIWEQVWSDFNRIYQPPKLNEGFDKIIMRKV